jgi:DNA-3-methyladenine glycosylase I
LSDGLTRCGWLDESEIYRHYHDTEWGVPEYDSRALWEKLILDGFQAGLSWITVLKKREAFIEAFEGFDPHLIATWGEADVERLLVNPGIVRHRGKIAATISNANAFTRLEREQSFSSYCWSFVGDTPIQGRIERPEDRPAQTTISVTLSKDLKKRGFKFCGPTIVYAWMQACGLVNDHSLGCHRFEPCRLMGSKAR